MSSRSEDTSIQTQHNEQKNLTGLLNLISIAGLAVCAILAVWAYKSGIEPLDHRKYEALHSVTVDITTKDG